MLNRRESKVTCIWSLGNKAIRANTELFYTENTGPTRLIYSKAPSWSWKVETHTLFVEKQVDQG